MLGLVVFVACVFAVQGQTTTVQTCTGSAAQGAPQPLNAYIEGCVTPPCALPQGQDVVLHLVFQAPRSIRSMTTRAQAFLLFFPIDWDQLGDYAVTCNFLTNSFCPVIQGEVLQYTMRMRIEEFFPVGVAPTVEFRIEDENGTPITCIRVPIVVAPPLKALSHN